MKILYISQYFPPEMGAPAARVSELSRAWALRGHDITVLTGFPNHPTGRVFRGYRRKILRLFMQEDFQRIKVQRTWLFPLPNRKSWERMLNYASFCLSAIIRGLFLSKPDLVIATSPQLLVGLSGLVIARLKRAPFIFEVRDLWPESLAAVGNAKRNSPLMWLLRKVASALYNRADHIVVVTNAFRDYIEKNYGVTSHKISVIPNGVDQKLFAPQEPSEAVKKEFHLENRFVIAYIGTIGNAHGISTLVDVAKELEKSEPQIFFLVIGEGAEKKSLENMIGVNKLSNIAVFSAQPRTRLPAIISSSAICLVLLKKAELFKTVIPTKMLEYMACGRPLIAGVEGEAAELIHASNSGVCVEPGDSQALSEAIRSLFRDSALRQSFGQNARAYIVKFLSRERTATDYLSVMNSVHRLASQK
jgi:glycosyltransferase involved in cell wall biosynthesis